MFKLSSLSSIKNLIKLRQLNILKKHFCRDSNTGHERLKPCRLVKGKGITFNYPEEIERERLEIFPSSRMIIP